MVTFGKHDVLVIGAGVSGLTSAICLAEAGMSVRVLTAEPPQQTTSATAGASWGPYLVTDPRIVAWSLVSRAELECIALREPEAGVRLVSGIEAAPAFCDPPDWAPSIHGFRLCAPNELPDGYLTGWEYTIPLVDMPRYLSYLENRLADAGTRIEINAIGSLDEIRGIAPIVINCGGLGARRLVDDRELYAIAGQVVIVDNPGIDRFFQDVAEGDDLTYVFPHSDYVVLGGTRVIGSEDVTVDPDVTDGIIKRCTNVEPRLRDATVLGHRARVGLRPTRDTVRLEREDVDGYVLVHNYGHGGAGVTLSWGCAREVLALVEQI
jgi:D-amino-acid oxidase